MAVKKSDDDGQPTPTKASQAPKDLITLTNARNGETYKFACKTCIDGHRAPLCDPKKHRGKVMFRRPAPGRPARQCGHPKAAKCDCLAKRTLCCVLSSDQWDMVEQGQAVEVSMYDSQEDLDAAQQRLPTSSQSTSSFAPDSANTPVNDGSFSTVSTPSLAPSMQMFGVAGTRNDSEPGTEPFGWTRELPQMPMHNVAPQYLPPANYMQQSGPMYQQFPHGYPLQTPGVPPVNLSHGSISQQAALPWPQPRPEYLPFDQRQFISQFDPQYGAMRLEQMHLNPEIREMQPSQSLFAPPGHVDRFTGQQHVYQPVPLPELHNFAMDTDLIDFDPSLPPNDMQDVTQSCCSSKRVEPQQAGSFSNWQFPPSAPTQQFPCPRCASTMCTCTNCPEVMQNPQQNGAWARACGRSGHLDAEGYLGTNPLEQRQPIPGSQRILQPQQVQPQQASLLQEQPVNLQQQAVTSSMAPAASSCCGGTSRPQTAQESPFAQSPHDAAQWPLLQHAEMQHQSIPHDAARGAMTLDHQDPYQPSNWQNEH